MTIIQALKKYPKMSLVFNDRSMSWEDSEWRVWQITCHLICRTKDPQIALDYLLGKRPKADT